MRVVSDIDVVAELNRVVAMHASSLANYLGDAVPWVRVQHPENADLVTQIAANQRETIGELGDYIIELDGVVDTGLYPMEFTGYHDLSFGYLGPLMVEEFTDHVEAMQGISKAVAGDPRAQALVDRAIGAAKAHIDLLHERLRG